MLWLLNVRVPIVLTILVLVYQRALAWRWPNVWAWDPHGVGWEWPLQAVNFVLAVVFLSTLADPCGNAGRVGTGLAFLMAEAFAVIYVAFTHPALFRLVVLGGLLLALGAWIGLAILWQRSTPTQIFRWLTPTFFWQFGIPAAIVIVGGLALAGVGVPATWALSVVMAGAAIFAYALGQFVIVLQVSTGRAGADEDYPKSYVESLRLIANVLVVANGVLLGTLKDSGDFPGRPAALLILAAGIAIGVFHLSVLVGGIHSEFTVKETRPYGTGTTETTTYLVTLGRVHARTSNVLLNLQYYSIIIGTVLIAIGAM